MGKAPCAAAETALPSGPINWPNSGTLPLLASAKQINPGMMNRNTGRSFRKLAKMLPRRAMVSLGAPSARCTMYWSVHQYHKPMIGAQKSMPSQGNLSLKYQACVTTAPAASFTCTGDQVDSTPAGVRGFHRLNISDPQNSRSLLQPPSSFKP